MDDYKEREREKSTAEARMKKWENRQQIWEDLKKLNQAIKNKRLRKIILDLERKLKPLVPPTAAQKHQAGREPS